MRTERTEIVQPLALAVLKTPYTGFFFSGSRSNFINYEVNVLWYYTCTKKYHHSMFLKTKEATNAYLPFF